MMLAIGAALVFFRQGDVPIFPVLGGDAGDRCSSGRAAVRGIGMATYCKWYGIFAVFAAGATVRAPGTPDLRSAGWVPGAALMALLCHQRALATMQARGNGQL